MNPGGLRDYVDQVFQRILGRLTQLFNERNALITLQIVTIQEFFQGSFEKN
jgi:hypothetical protein